MADQTRDEPWSDVPMWMRRVGLQAWLLIGMVLAAIGVAAALSALSGIVAPLVVALIFALLCQPLVDWAERRGISRGLASGVTLVVILVASILVATTVILGLVQELPKVLDQAAAGAAELARQLDALAAGDIDPSILEAARTMVTKAIPIIGRGLTGLLTTGFSSAAAFGIGTFFALFALYYMLKDGPRFGDWLASKGRTQRSREQTRELIEDGGRSLRGYFKGTAISAGVSSSVVLLALLYTGTPLVVPIMVLYFITSFIPYVGAWIGGAYTVLIALSTGGPEAGLIVAIAVLISNGTLQNVVTSWALGETLDLHPLLILVVTALGSAVAGILGMILAAPVTAVLIHTVEALREPPASPAAEAS